MLLLLLLLLLLVATAVAASAAAVGAACLPCSADHRCLGSDACPPSSQIEVGRSINSGFMLIRAKEITARLLGNAIISARVNKAFQQVSTQRALDAMIKSKAKLTVRVRQWVPWAQRGACVLHAGARECWCVVVQWQWQWQSCHACARA